MNDQQFFLANAYLDGELTADERALAESDPIVMAGVDELSALQADIRDVAPPTEAARETAIAAAMSAYAAVDPADAAASVPAPRAAARRAVVVPFWRRPSGRRTLAFAAAVVAVGLLGVVVVDLGGRDDLDTADTAETAFDADDTSRLTESVTRDDTADAAAAEVAPSAPSGDEADGAEDMIVAGDDSADAGADDLGAGVVPVSEAAEPVPGAELPSPDALGEFGAELLAQRRAGALPPSPNTMCAFVDRPAEILAQSGFATESGLTELLVAVDETGGIVYAIDPESCVIVLASPLG